MARSKPFLLKLFGFLASFFISGAALSDTFQVTDLAGGMNDAKPGNLIEDNEAVSISNFHVNPVSRGLDQRRGSQNQNSTQLTGKLAVDVFSHVQSDGDSFLISFTSRTVSYSATNGVTWSSIFSTATLNSVWDGVGFVDDNFYMVNQNNGGYYFNGTAFVQAGSIPSGKFIEAFQNRLFVANTSSFPYRVFFSGLLQGSTWTTSTDYFDMPESVTCVGEPFDGGLPIYTQNTTWMLRGSSPTDFYLQQISGQIGCTQNRDVQNFDINGTEYQVFFSLGPNRSRKSLYALVGNRIIDLGKRVPNLMDSVSAFDSSARTFEWDTDEDFDSGVASDTLHISELSDAVLSYRQVDDFIDGELSSNPVWVQYDTTAGSWGVSSLKARYSQSSNGNSGLYTNFGVSTGTWSFTINTSAASLSVGSLSVSAPANHGGINTLSTCSSGGSMDDGYYFGVSGSIASIVLQKCSGGTRTSLVSASQSITSGVDHTIVLKRDSSGNFTLYYDGSLVGTATDTTFTSLPYFSLISASNSGAMTTDFSNVNYYASSGTFTSEIKDGGASVSSWDIFSCLTSGGVTQSFSYRTNPVSAAISTTAWTSVSCGSDISGSDRYIQWKDDFSVAVATTYAVLENVIINYTESSGSSQPGDMEVWGNDLWMTYTSDGGTYNDSIILMNNEAKFSSLTGLNVYGFAAHNARLLSGTSINDGVSGGYAVQLDVGETDNGTAVTSSVVLKHQDFPGDNSDWEKDLSHVYFNYGVSVGTFTATINENFTEFSQDKTVTASSGFTIGRYRFEADPGTAAHQFGLEFTNSYPGARLRLYPPLTYYFSKQTMIP